MDPTTSEADERQLEPAKARGDASGQALRHMAEEVAHDGGEQGAGQDVVGYAEDQADGPAAGGDS
jgi:hypothetical protein